MDLTPTLLWQVVTTLAIAPLAYFLKGNRPPSAALRRAALIG